MKKLFITAAIATMFSFAAFADGGKKVKADDEKTVTYAALNQFEADFDAAANVTWTVTPNCQKATFTIDGQKFTAFYDLRGEYLGRTQTIAYASLPTSVKNQIAKSYKDYTVTEVIKYETQNDKEPVVTFVNIKNAKSEAILSVSANDTVQYFQTVK